MSRPKSAAEIMISEVSHLNMDGRICDPLSLVLQFAGDMGNKFSKPAVFLCVLFLNICETERYIGFPRAQIDRLQHFAVGGMNRRPLAVLDITHWSHGNNPMQPTFSKDAFQRSSSTAVKI